MPQRSQPGWSQVGNWLSKSIEHQTGHPFNPATDSTNPEQWSRDATGQWHRNEPWGKWKFILPAIAGSVVGAPFLFGGAGGAVAEAGAQAADPALGTGATYGAATAADVAGTTGIQKLLMRGGLIGGLSAIGQATHGRPADMSPELQRLWSQQHARQQAQNPLYESILRMAFNRLPTASRAGLAAPSLSGAAAQTPPLQSGTFNEPPQLRELFRDTEMRQHMTDPLLQAITRLSQSRLQSAGGADNIVWGT